MKKKSKSEEKCFLALKAPKKTVDTFRKLAKKNKITQSVLLHQMVQEYQASSY